jgi:hypothetical protein
MPQKKGKQAQAAPETIPEMSEDPQPGTSGTPNSEPYDHVEPEEWRSQHEEDNKEQAFFVAEPALGYSDISRMTERPSTGTEWLMTVEEIVNSDDKALQRSWEECLEIGMMYVPERALDPKEKLEHLTSRKDITEFQAELNDLRTLLSKLTEATSLREDSAGQHYVAIDDSVYHILQGRLHGRRVAAAASLEMYKISHTDCQPPSWYNPGSPRGWMVKDQFCIWAAVYRARVEHFLAKLHSMHSYKKNIARCLLDTPSYRASIPPRNTNPIASKPPRPSFKPPSRPLGPQPSKATNDRLSELLGRSASRAPRENDQPAQEPREAFGGRQHTDYQSASRPGSRNSGTGSQAPRQFRRDLPPHLNSGTQGRGYPDPYDSDSSSGNSSDSSSHSHRRQGNNTRRTPQGSRKPDLRNRTQSQNNTGADKKTEPYFDVKLKTEEVPKWDGDVDTLMRWLMKVEDIANESETVRRQLGRIVPKRLNGSAETWYYSLPLDYRREAEASWDKLYEVITDFYLTRKFWDRQKMRASRAHYREQGHRNETPSEYYIRKTELLRITHSLSDSEIISEVMDGAPPQWNTVLTTQFYSTVVEFQQAIRFHEDTLQELPSDVLKYRRNQYEGRTRDYSENDKSNAKVNLVGASRTMSPPKYPKDDSNVSAKTTPKAKGARPCRHCGSENHWDRECKYHVKEMKQAGARLATVTREELEAQDLYDTAYYAAQSDSDSDFY